MCVQSAFCRTWHCTRLRPRPHGSHRLCLQRVAPLFFFFICLWNEPVFMEQFTRRCWPVQPRCCHWLLKLIWVVNKQCCWDPHVWLTFANRNTELAGKLVSFPANAWNLGGAQFNLMEQVNLIATKEMLKPWGLVQKAPLQNGVSKLWLRYKAAMLKSKLSNLHQTSHSIREEQTSDECRQILKMHALLF